MAKEILTINSFTVFSKDKKCNKCTYARENLKLCGRTIKGLRRLLSFVTLFQSDDVIESVVDRLG